MIPDQYKCSTIGNLADLPSQCPDAKRIEDNQSAGPSLREDSPTSFPAYLPMLSSVLIQHGVCWELDSLLEEVVVVPSWAP